MADTIGSTKTKLETLKTAAEQANQALANGDISQEQYDALQREIIETDFMKGLADGINKSKKVVAKAVSGVADTMKISLNSDLSYQLDGITGAVMSGGSESSVVNNYYQNDNSRTVNQTNNSPKSLSRLEIYRQTRNALKT